MFTKVMFPNLLLVQRCKFLGVLNESLIKKYRFERRKISKINFIELSNLGDNTTNANSPNKTITNEPQSPLKKSS